MNLSDDASTRADEASAGAGEVSADEGEARHRAEQARNFDTSVLTIASEVDQTITQESGRSDDARRQDESVRSSTDEAQRRLRRPVRAAGQGSLVASDVIQLSHDVAHRAAQRTSAARRADEFSSHAVMPSDHGPNTSDYIDR